LGPRTWFWGPNQETVCRWFCGQTTKPRVLSPASRQTTWLDPHRAPARLSMTSSCSCRHHVTRTRSRCPPGPLNRAYLSLYLPEAPQGWRPFAPVLHLQQHELGRSLHLRTKPRVSPTPVVNHSSLRSGHPSTTGTLLVLSLFSENLFNINFVKVY
jgi:hypothetical protein